MTKRDLFRIVIRLFGIYMAIELLYTIPQTLLSLYFDSEMESVLIILTMLVSFATISMFLIFKADALISILRLDKGFESESINFKEELSTTATRIGISLIGLFFIFSAVPGILFQLYVIFKASIAEPSLGMLDSSIALYSPNYPQLIQEILSAVTGYFVLSYSGRMADWIAKTK